MLPMWFLFCLIRCHQIWAAIVPALLAKASRQKFPNATYKVYGGNFMIGFVILFGVLNIVAQVGANLGWFASFAG